MRRGACDPGSVWCGTSIAGTGGTPEEISSVAPGRADLWRGLAVSPGTNPVPESEGEEPRICAVIPVGLTALSGTDPAADP